MKAIVCKEYGLPSKLVLEEIPSPVPGPKEVLVEVKAASLNFPDTLIIQGLYQFKPVVPFTPGSDICGVVKEVGSEVNHINVGDEVVAVVVYGGFAEQVCVPAQNCFPKPPGMPPKVAASFMMAYATSYHALKDRAGLQEGETLMVLGASGGVGLAAVELGKLMRAQVIAAASTDEKLALCKDYGADETINYTKEDIKAKAKELTDGNGVDVIYDPVGDQFSEPALRAIAWRGRYLVVGFAAGQIPKIPLNLPLLKGCQIVGVFTGAFMMRSPKDYMTNAIQLMKWYAAGQLKPHIHATYSLGDTPKALEAMMNREVRGKVVIEM